MKENNQISISFSQRLRGHCRGRCLKARRRNRMLCDYFLWIEAREAWQSPRLPMLLIFFDALLCQKDKSKLTGEVYFVFHNCILAFLPAHLFHSSWITNSWFLCLKCSSLLRPSLWKPVILQGQVQNSCSPLSSTDTTTELRLTNSMPT